MEAALDASPALYASPLWPLFPPPVSRFATIPPDEEDLSNAAALEYHNVQYDNLCSDLFLRGGDQQETGLKMMGEENG